MRVEGVPPLLGITAMAAGAERRSQQAFDPDQAAGGTTAPGPALTPPTTSVEMLVALASVDPGVERRRKMAVEAERGLVLLERLHQEAMGGDILPERLAQLAEWSASFALPDDPALAAVARDIDLRVRVELAKHDIRA
jgi:hypothetical protein